MVRRQTTRQPNENGSIPSRAHLIGIGGAGMAALAALLLDIGCEVTGSDREESDAVGSLRRRGVSVCVPHDVECIGDPDLVVYSSAVPKDNVELLRAESLGIRAIKRAAMLGRLSSLKDTIAVAGTHGKTTTTAMLAWILFQAGCEPGWAIGGEVPDLGGSAHWGVGNWFAVEADEYDRSFLTLHPQVAVINNIEADHLDYYGHPAAIYQAFAAFASRLPANGLLIIGEDAAAKRIAEESRWTVQSVGLTRACDWSASQLVLGQNGSQFRFRTPQGESADCWLQVAGIHNVRNALAALACAAHAGVTLEDATAALAKFSGAARRFQRVGEAAGVVVYEDYAHHPSEIRAVLEASRQVHPPTRGKMWAVFEPHTYSRTEALFDGFAQAFKVADRVVITEVYSPSGRDHANDGRDAAALAAAAQHGAVHYAPSHRDALTHLVDGLSRGDFVVIMGAGPIHRLAHQLVDRLGRSDTLAT